VSDGSRTRLAVVGVGLLLLNAWEWIFGAFFPTRNGTLGWDWAHKLPLLLDGTNWFLQNGWTRLPWFTPSFCGGIPLFPHPASFYVSLPQWLSFAMDPLLAAHVALLVFAAAGGLGTYGLLRRVYRVREWAALLGAGVFLFNGFYAHRMLIGHLEFHGFMLTPLLALWLLEAGAEAWSWRTAGRVLGAGAVLAYLFLSGATQLFFPLLLSLVALWLMALLAVPAPPARAFPARLAAAGTLALALGASKLVGSLAILAHLPRDFYPLPGVEGVGRALWLVLVALARGGRAVDLDVIVSSEFEMQVHELEYGVTPLPFLLLAAWAGVAAATRPRGRRLPPGRLAPIAALVALLLLPVLLNLRAVGAVLEDAPVFRSLSNLLRWLSLYLLPLAVASGLALERLPLGRARSALALLGLAVVVGVNAVSDRTPYHEQPYPPDAVRAASQIARARGAPTPITGIEATIVGGEIQLPVNRNDVLVRGMSQLACYEPLFGFRLERLPRRDLRPGDVLQVRGGQLNLKNPACYLYPEENGCAPGDHFRADQIESARRFTHFRPFPWKRSGLQRAADAVSAAALLGSLAAALVIAAAALRERRR
jgi:hypothetical protein